MTRFFYRGLTATGKVIVGSSDSETKDEVRRYLEAKELIVIEITTESYPLKKLDLSEIGLSFQVRTFFQKPSHYDITTFIQNLGILLNTSIRLDQALNLLEEPEMSGVLSTNVHAIRMAVMAGESLSNALAHEPDLFPKSMVALIKLSEQSGMLSHALLAIAQERMKSFRLRQKALDGLQYPAVLLTTAFSVLAFFISFVLPHFEPIFIDLGAKADPTLINILIFSKALENHRYIGISSLIACIFIFVIILRNRDRRAKWFGFITQIPGIRSLYRNYITIVFCTNFSHLIKSGVSVADAINLVGQTISRPHSQAAWAKARDDVRHGDRAYEALSRIGELSPVAIRMIRIGEEIGQLPELLKQASDLFEIRFERQLEKLIGIVGPLAIIAVSAVIGGLIVSIMSALMSINELTR